MEQQAFRLLESALSEGIVLDGDTLENIEQSVDEEVSLRLAEFGR
jgi:hypothetical protein